MSHAAKEIFYSLQGEGCQAGRPAVFCRSAGCELLTGRERDRASAVWSLCFTNFVGTDAKCGGRFADANSLAAAVEAMWGGGEPDWFVVLARACRVYSSESL